MFRNNHEIQVIYKHFLHQNVYFKNQENVLKISRIMIKIFKKYTTLFFHVNFMKKSNY